MDRRHNFQTISWFWDIYDRKLLELDPPYQRRSVWNQTFKENFIETILLGYPAPAIFLYEEISAEGRSIYNVVDGKQRLSAIFDFVSGFFPISEKSEIENLKGFFFSNLDPSIKKKFWSYQFLVEYLPVSNEPILKNIFDRINRNVAKLTPQELRHARMDGEFIKLAEHLSDWLGEQLPKNFPRFDTQSKKQMKDVELIAQLMLLVEEGPKSYKQEELDKAFLDRDSGWERHVEVESDFKANIVFMKSILSIAPDDGDLSSTRLRNQADFYSLFGAIQGLRMEGNLPNEVEAKNRLLSFIRKVDSEEQRDSDAQIKNYYNAARSASSDKGPRETRITILKKVLAGEI